jgi:hypothetical protein
LTARVANRRQSRQWPAHNCRSTAALAKWKNRSRVLEWRECCRRSVSRRVRHPRVRSLMSRTGKVPRIFTRAQPKNRALLPRTGGEKRARDRKRLSGFTPAWSSSCGTGCWGGSARRKLAGAMAGDASGSIAAGFNLRSRLSNAEPCSRLSHSSSPPWATALRMNISSTDRPRRRRLRFPRFFAVRPRPGRQSSTSPAGTRHGTEWSKSERRSHHNYHSAISPPARAA